MNKHYSIESRGTMIFYSCKHCPKQLKSETGIVRHLNECDKYTIYKLRRENKELIDEHHQLMDEKAEISGRIEQLVEENNELKQNINRPTTINQFIQNNYQLNLDPNFASEVHQYLEREIKSYGLNEDNVAKIYSSIEECCNYEQLTELNKLISSPGLSERDQLLALHNSLGLMLLSSEEVE